MDQISKEDYLDWKQSLVTRYYFAQINRRIIDLMKEVGTGRTFNSNSVDQTALETARVIGAVEALQDILDIEYEGDE